MPQAFDFSNRHSTSPSHKNLAVGEEIAVFGET
jgi:hypothetical protein